MSAAPGWARRGRDWRIVMEFDVLRTMWPPAPSGVAWVLRNGAEGEPSRIDVFAPTGVLTDRVTAAAFPSSFSPI